MTTGIWELDDGSLLIVGRKITDAEWMEVHTQIGEDENAIVIDRALLANVDPFPSNHKAPDNPYEGIDENYTKPDVINVPQ